MQKIQDWLIATRLSVIKNKNGNSIKKHPHWIQWGWIITDGFICSPRVWILGVGSYRLCYLHLLSQSSARIHISSGLFHSSWSTFCLFAWYKHLGALIHKNWDYRQNNYHSLSVYIMEGWCPHGSGYSSPRNLMIRTRWISYRYGEFSILREW